MEADRIRLRVRNVGSDDDWHDDALGRADDPHLRACRTSGDGRRQAVCCNHLVRRRLPAGMDSVLARSYLRAMGAGACGVTYTDDDEREQYPWWHCVDHRWPLSVDAAQGGLSVPVPNAACVHFAPWRVSRRSGWRFEARHESRNVLHRLLLGAHGASVRWGRHESLLD